MRSLQKSLGWYSLHPSALILKLAGMIYDRFHPKDPWISHHAVSYCEKNLNDKMHALEWGSGRSTRWYANLLGKLTSIEHHEGWYNTVSKQLTDDEVRNVDYRLIKLDHPESEPCLIRYQTLPSYVAVGKEFSPDTLDFIVIDGHYRQTCVTIAIGILKSGGLLLIDNSNWMPLEDWGVPEEWPIVHRSSGFYGETTIWKKP